MQVLRALHAASSQHVAATVQQLDAAHVPHALSLNGKPPHFGASSAGGALASSSAFSVLRGGPASLVFVLPALSEMGPVAVPVQAAVAKASVESAASVAMIWFRMVSYSALPMPRSAPCLRLERPAVVVRS